MSSEKTHKTAKLYQCVSCDYDTSNATDYTRHIATRKHTKLTLSSNINNLSQKNAESFLCSHCNKCYKERSGLWRHNQSCKPATDASNNFVIDKELVMLLIKENSELKNMMIDTQNQIIKHISKEKYPTFL